VGKKLMLKFKNNSLLPNLDHYGLKLYEKALILYRDLCCWVQFLKETQYHWGKADDRNCNYGHPRWRTWNQVSGKNLLHITRKF
jgi:hypothetical protein